MRYKLHLLRVVAFLALTATMSLSRASAEEPKQLLQTVKTQNLDLSPKQAQILNRLKKLPTSKDVNVATFQSDAIATADGTLNIAAGPELNMQIKGFKLTSDKTGKRLEWKGEGKTDNVMLRASKKSLTGLIVQGKDVYSVEPLGGGLHAVIKLDQSKFPLDHPPGYKQIEADAQKKEGADKDKKGTGVDRKSASLADTAPAGPAVVRVFVAYTKAVDEQQGDINELIQSAVDIGNVGMQNSLINGKLELAGTAKMDYTESGTHEKDLERFKGKGDGFMEEIHTLRDTNKADVCVLLIDNAMFCGLAAEIWATNESQAFVVVHHDCAKNNLSLAHELGHIFGARHNLLVDGTLSPFVDGHCHLSTTSNWRTIMAYPTTDQPNRLPYWSNPSVKIGTEATGITGVEDNARVLNLTLGDISKFRP
jgi:hypothetical protein